MARRLWLWGAGVSQESEGQESGLDLQAGGVNATAIALALGGASRDEADSFLKAERKLIAKQSHHLDEQFKRLRMGVLGDRLSITLKVLTMLVGLAVAGLLGIMIWNAAHDEGLVIEAFTVPPDYAARGLTGQVVAGEVLSNLASFQALSNSIRAASSYSNNWGDDIKIEIPETGISVSEFNRLLHAWLGHETHITGAIYRTPRGIAVTARAGSDTAPTLAGGDAELDSMLRKISEAIYRVTQPYRFAQYTFSAYGFAEAETAQKSIIANGAPQDRFWAYNGLITMYAAQLDFEKASKAAQHAMAMRPDSGVPYYNLARNELVAQHDEAALAASEATFTHKRDPDITEQAWSASKTWVECLAARLHGDFIGAIGACQRAEFLVDLANGRTQARLLQLPAFAGAHDAAALREAYANLPPTDDLSSLAARAGYEALSEVELGHWSALLDRRTVFASSLTKLPYAFFFNARTFQPALAYALALSGNFSGAHAEIDKTQADCSGCLRAHGRIDNLEKNWGGADYWFARAVDEAPSIPFAFTDWGMSLLARGQPDAAIEKFILANRRGPHFADPLEGWGEALMAKNQSHLALKKFAEAEKYAPNWGRLHVKWGEALGYAGRKDEARAQFDRAGLLDLSAAERAELAGDLGHV